MPIATFIDGLAELEKFVDEMIQELDNLVAMRHCESSARTKVVLNVNNE